MAKEKTESADALINKEKFKALQSTIEKIEKSYGKGSSMKRGGAAIEEVEIISTGSIGLDADWW